MHFCYILKNFLEKFRKFSGVLRAWTAYEAEPLKCSPRTEILAAHLHMIEMSNLILNKYVLTCWFYSWNFHYRPISSLFLASLWRDFQYCAFHRWKPCSDSLAETAAHKMSFSKWISYLIFSYKHHK